MRVKAALLMIVISGGAWSEQETVQIAQSRDPVPSMELLEFLGTFQDGNGHWFDPLLLVSADKERPPSKEDDGEETGTPDDEATDDDK